jgi:hypothetical protein
VGDLEVTRFTYHNPKRTNWESYQEGLKANLWVVPRVINSVLDVELAVDMLQQPITKTVQPGWLPCQGWFLGGTKSGTTLKL